jgi:hypothetical protein
MKKKFTPSTLFMVMAIVFLQAQDMTRSPMPTPQQMNNDVTKFGNELSTTTSFYTSIATNQQGCPDLFIPGHYSFKPVSDTLWDSEPKSNPALFDTTHNKI